MIMNIVHQNAAARLLEKVKSLEPSPMSSWRCIHVNLADKPERYNHGLRAHFVAKTLIDRLADFDGYLFLCEDGDIFILFQGQVKSIVGKLSKDFIDITPDITDDHRFKVYDLSNGWKILYDLCRAKARTVLAAPEGFYACFAYSMDGVMA